MKVSELISKLSQLPQNSVAVVKYFPNDYCDAELLIVSDVSKRDGAIVFDPDYKNGHKDDAVLIS